MSQSGSAQRHFILDMRSTGGLLNLNQLIALIDEASGNELSVRLASVIDADLVQGHFCGRLTS